MARLNALFPAGVTVPPEDTIDLSPCTPGLLDSIRLCIYEHLMRADTTPKENEQSFADKFTSWCSIPKYEEAQDALLRYSGEFKKMEETCISTLHMVELKRAAASDRTGPSRLSYVAPSDGSKSPDIVPDTPSSSNVRISDTSTIADISLSSFMSSAPTSVASISSGQLTPLLKGMPGRELSAAKTDGAAFAMDFTAPDVLVYPDDLSKTEFYVHPLAKDLDMNTDEKARLGLIFPKERSSRTF